MSFLSRPPNLRFFDQLNFMKFLLAQQWVRTRAKQGGFPRLSGVHLVSSVRGTGVADLLNDLKGAAGSLGDVWVVGAQVRDSVSTAFLLDSLPLLCAFRERHGVSTASSKSFMLPLYEHIKREPRS